MRKRGGEYRMNIGRIVKEDGNRKGNRREEYSIIMYMYNIIYNNSNIIYNTSIRYNSIIYNNNLNT
jgi:hypothetical protein